MNWRGYMKNKLKLGQAAGVVSVCYYYRCCIYEFKQHSRCQNIIKGKQNSQCGGGPWSDRGGRFHRASTSGVTSALTYYGADVSVAQNDSNVVTASAQGAQVGNTAQETRTGK